METIRIDIRLSPKELKEIFENNDNWVLQIPDDMSSSEIQELFYMHKNSPYCSNLIIGAIAEHLSTPVGILEQIAAASDWSILASLATNPNINDNIINKIMETDNYTVLEHLAYNPAMSETKLSHLLKITQNVDLREVVRGVMSDRKEQKGSGLHI